MNNIPSSRILGTIQQIREVEKMIAACEKQLPDPVIQFTIFQFQELKQEFVKQLFADLLLSNWSVSDMEPFFRKATTYLKKFDRKSSLTKELKANLTEVVGMMAVSA